MRIGYFHCGGDTETGGLERLLRRINPRVAWERCFPAVDKPAGKLGRQRPEARETATGTDLRAEMVRRLRRRPTGAALDAVLLVDDADCRFHGRERRGYDDWLSGLTRDVREAMAQPDLPVYALFASPEVESWFYADWEHSFGTLPDRTLATQLRRALNAELLGAGCADEPEAFGCPLDAERGTCTSKLSERIQLLLEEVQGSDARRVGLPMIRYSKRIDGTGYHSAGHARIRRS